jgi:hypothetical protein
MLNDGDEVDTLLGFLFEIVNFQEEFLSSTSIDSDFKITPAQLEEQP